ncbi:hypothetical protein CDL15_Pgr015120 [Punica granatum]|uniref:Uncharacterized protein n=1 Tax=Punica granatum TaxID=22663 RepID=A0A218WN84_PUNGR|nr:hypothetical protein CDL15_Pgr015120 [Punica granatum]
MLLPISLRPARLPTRPPERLHARVRPAARLACPNVHPVHLNVLSRVPPSHPDSQTLPQLFSRIPRQGAQGPPGPGNKFQTTFRNSARSPEVRFSDHERLPVNLRVFPRKAETTTISEYLTITSKHLKAFGAH